MAQFDIEYSRRLPPAQGPNAIINPEVGQGAGMVARAIGGIGGALFDIDQKIQAAEDAMELSTLDRQREEIAVAGFAEMETMQDPEGRAVLFQKMMQDSENLAATTKRRNVQESYIQRLNADAPRWQVTFNQIDRRKRITTIADEKEIGDQHDYETGNFPNFASRQDEAERLGVQTPQMTQWLKDNFLTNSVLSQAAVEGSRNPENGRKMLSDLKDLDENQTMRRDRILAHINSIENQQTAQEIAGEEALWDLSIKPGTTSEDILKAVDALPYHTAAEKDQLYKSTMSRVKMINEGKGDPYIYRQDTAKYWELYQNAVDGKGKESDFRQAVRDHKITINDYKELNNVVEGLTPKSTADETGTAMKRLRTLIESAGSDLASFKEDIDSAVIMGETILEAKIAEAKEANKPLKGTDLTKEVLRVHRDMKAKLEEGKTAEEILPMNIEAVLAGYEQPTQTQFLSVVGYLKRAGRTKDAQEYYDKWAEELWP